MWFCCLINLASWYSSKNSCSPVLKFCLMPNLEPSTSSKSSGFLFFIYYLNEATAVIVFVVFPTPRFCLSHFEINQEFLKKPEVLNVTSLISDSDSASELINLKEHSSFQFFWSCFCWESKFSNYSSGWEELWFLCCSLKGWEFIAWEGSRSSRWIESYLSLS